MLRNRTMSKRKSHKLSRRLKKTRTRNRLTRSRRRYSPVLHLRVIIGMHETTRSGCYGGVRSYPGVIQIHTVHVRTSRKIMQIISAMLVKDLHVSRCALRGGYRGMHLRALAGLPDSGFKYQPMVTARRNRRCWQRNSYPRQAKLTHLFRVHSIDMRTLLRPRSAILARIASKA